MELIEQVKIQVDERYTIAVSKDHNQGLVVQVARLNPTHVSTDKGALYKGHQPVVVWQKVIAFGAVDKTNGKIAFKDHSAIESQLALAIAEAQGIASKSVNTENFVDGLLTKLNADVNK